MHAALLAVAVLVGAPAAKDAPKDRVSIVGEWVAESAVHDGQRLETAGARQVFRANGTWSTLGPDGKELRGGPRPYKVDPKASPPAIDLWYGPEAKPERAHLGIYRLDGDTLTVCSAPPGAARPTKFESPTGAELSVVTLRRAKAKD